MKRSRYNWGLIACVGGLVAVLLAGTCGYRYLEGWSWLDSLYMTVITVSTVGFGEVHPMTPGGRGFTLVLIVVGVGTVATAFSVIAKTIFQHQLRIFMERRGMHKEIRSMAGHIIVCGYGRMGAYIVDELRRSGLKVVVVESEPQVIDELSRNGIPAVLGDASDEDILAIAGIERAEALVAALATDADNLFLTITARGMSSELTIISRIEDDAGSRKFIKAGANRVVSPLAAGSSRIIRLLTRPDIVDFVELVVEDDVRFEIRRIEIDAESPFAGRTLAEGRVRQHVGGLVLSVKRKSGLTVFDPEPDMRLLAGDVIFVAGAVGKSPATPHSK